MSFDEVRCIIPICDMCGSDCWDGVEHPPHLSPMNLRVAQDILTNQYGWTFEAVQPAGQRMLCPRCTAYHQCARAGHHAWYTPELAEQWPGGPIQLCETCHCVRRDTLPLDGPPPGHPESMDAELPDADEEWLAELDALLDPGGASP